MAEIIRMTEKGGKKQMIFHRTEEEWKQEGGYWTAKEIFQQPETWRKTLFQIREERFGLQAFINTVKAQKDYDIVFAGAGTSEYIGNALAPALRPYYSGHIRSCATTDIVSNPEYCLFRDRPTLLVSFGRSGNSPESIGAIRAADTVCTNIRHLLITCNPKGALSRYAEGKDNCYALNLTPETHDMAFAMTSSFSNMYLAGLLVFRLDALEEMENQTEEVIRAAAEFLEKGWESIRKLTDDFDFSRIIYLGSGALKGFAQESALKICELTQGRVDTIFNSPLGFRHGPKSVINDHSLCVVFLSPDNYARQYEYDLIREMSAERKNNRILIIGCTEDPVSSYADAYLSLDCRTELTDSFAGMAFIPAAQVTALLKSLSFGITPDNPCPSGEVNRVVKGVTLYPYTLQRENI